MPTNFTVVPVEDGGVGKSSLELVFREEDITPRRPYSGEGTLLTLSGQAQTSEAASVEQLNMFTLRLP